MLNAHVDASTGMARDISCTLNIVGREMERKIKGKGKRERPRLRWAEVVRKDLSKLGL